MPFKELLNAIHDVIRFIVLKAIDSGCLHLISELGKV